MPKQSVSQLSREAETLLLPLYCRALESRRSDPILVDTKASQIVAQLDYDFAALGANPFVCALLALRAREFDRTARDFLRTNPAGTIVELGCGLDTRFERVDTGQATWYELDQPEVIELRRKFLPEEPRRRFLAASLADVAWMQQLASSDGSPLFLAEGVFMHMPETEVKAVILELRRRFPGCQLMFDTCTPFEAQLSRLSPWATVDIGRLYFGLEHGQELEEWAEGVQLESLWHYFEEDEARLGWFQLLRFFPLLGQAFKILRYRLGH